MRRVTVQTFAVRHCDWQVGALGRNGASWLRQHARVHARYVISGLVAVLAGLLSASIVLAAGAGTWSATAPMNAARSGHLSVLLGTGKVLVVGSDSGTTTAELYDPATARWTPTAAALFLPHGLVTLADGRVLAVGGTEGRSAQLYDPVAGRWSATGSAPAAPSTLTLLPDGRVLAVGGFDVGAHAELFDPIAGVWRPTTRPLPLDGTGPLDSVLLSTGKVLVLSVNEGANTSNAQLFEPTTATWVSTGTPRVFVSGPAALLPNGKVLVVGHVHAGGTSFSIDGVAAVYDPVLGSWSAAASAIGFPNSLTLLRDGRVLAAGEEFGSAFSTPTVTLSPAAQLYNQQTGTWSATGSMTSPEGRPGQAATLLANGTVLVSGGGLGFAQTPLASAELYTPPTATTLPTSCTLSLAGTDAAGHAFIRVAARDIASGLASTRVVQADNATVVLPHFPSGYRDPAVVTATKVNSTQPSVLKLAVTNRDGATLACDPVMAKLVDEDHGNARQVFGNLKQTESKILVTNGSPGLKRVDLRVNDEHFRLDDLQDNEQRTVDVSSAMEPGDHNSVIVRSRGPHPSSAVLVISD